MTIRDGCSQVVGVGVASEMIYKENADVLFGPYCSVGILTETIKKFVHLNES